MAPQDLEDHGVYLLRGHCYEARHIACRAANGRGYGRLYPLDDADDIFHIEYGWLRLLRVVRCDTRPSGIDYRMTDVLASELRLVGISLRKKPSPNSGGLRLTPPDGRKYGGRDLTAM